MCSEKTTVEVRSEREIVMTRTFAAPRGLVWEAMSKPEYVREWYGLKYLSLEVCEIDHRVGGRWRFVLRAPDASAHTFSGMYTEIVAPERMTYTENYEPLGPGHEIVVTARYVENGGNTTLTCHLLYKSQVDRDAHIQSGMETGAQETHDRLADLLKILLRKG